jgi:RNA polymerase sigma factor (sigma-70 family)
MSGRPRISIEDARLTDEQSDLAGENFYLARWVVQRRHRAVVTLGWDETISAAWLGLCTAARGYVEQRGRFSTYACLCMNHAINNELKARNREQRVPVRPDGEKATTRSITEIDGVQRKTYRDGIGSVDGHDWLESLEPFEREVLELRTQGFTLKQIGDKFGFTREWIRQVQDHALTLL